MLSRSAYRFVLGVVSKGGEGFGLNADNCGTEEASVKKIADVRRLPFSLSLFFSSDAEV